MIYSLPFVWLFWHWLLSCFPLFSMNWSDPPQTQFTSLSDIAATLYKCLRMLRRFIMSKFTLFYVIKIICVSSIWRLNPPTTPPPLVTDIAPWTWPCNYVSAKVFGRIWCEEKLLWWGISAPLRYHLENRGAGIFFLVRGALLILINDVLVK